MDNLFLTGPLGTQINIGSWLDKTQGVDYGAHDLIRQQLVQSAFVEGARMSYETSAGARRMSFPLRVPSGGVAGMSLDALEASLRQMVRPGGYLDIKPDGVPTGEMVRFDILGGDVAHRNYSVDMQRIARRDVTLSLQTQPFGYWPTWIIAASVASVAIHGGGKLAMAAPIGDAPALAELTFVPTGPTQFAAGDVWYPDGFAWANGGRPSFVAALTGEGWAQWQYPASYGQPDSGVTPRRYLGATFMVFSAPPASAGFQNVGIYTIASALEPAYRGRFRVLLQTNNLARANQWAIDAVPGGQSAHIGQAAFASAAQAATAPATSANAGEWLDLGEISLPPAASGVQSTEYLRLWSALASSGATTTAFINGVYLLPLDGDSGILARGLTSPTIGVGTTFLSNVALRLRADQGGVVGLLASQPSDDLTRHYRGVMPRMGATTLQLDLVAWQRRQGGASLAADTFAATPAYAAVSLRYQPRFQFLKGI